MNVLFQKIPILPPQKVLEFLEEGCLCQRPKNLYEVYETQFKFPEGRGSLRQNPFCGGGMDIFWKNTLQGVIMLIISKQSCSLHLSNF